MATTIQNGLTYEQLVKMDSVIEDSEYGLYIIALQEDYFDNGYNKLLDDQTCSMVLKRIKKRRQFLIRTIETTEKELGIFEPYY